MKPKFKRLITRVSVLSLAGVLCMTLMPNMSTTVSARESLSHIESIKQDKIENKVPFRVLELVPGEGMGSLGYYVAGQEPTADWLQKLAVIESKDLRKQTAADLFNKLNNAGLLATDATPLKLLGEYEEYLPWEAVPTDAVPQELDLVDEEGNTRQENTEVKGTFVFAEDGSFVRVVKPTLAVDETTGEPTGTDNQVVEHFVRAQGSTADPADPAGVYYYLPEFAKVEPKTDDPGHEYDEYANMAIYTLVMPEAENPGDTGEEEPGTEPETPVAYYEYQGTAGQDDFYLNTAETYYYVVNQGRPYANYEAAVAAAEAAAADDTIGTDTGDGTTGTDTGDDTIGTDTGDGTTGTDTGDGTTGTDTGDGTTGTDTGDGTTDTATEPVIEKVYYAIGDEFAPAPEGEKGWFTIDVESYEYVGAGNGDYNFTPDENGGETVTVYYGTVLFTGGYTNNNWFAKETLDLDEDEMTGFQFQVDCYTPAQLSEMQVTEPEAFQELVGGADLIVLSAGFALDAFVDSATPANTPADSLEMYTLENDLSEAVANAIKAAVQPEDEYTDAKPMLVDGRLCSADVTAANLQELAKSLCQDDQGNVAAGVNENVYCYMPDADTAGAIIGRANLVTADFLKPFENQTESTAPYYDVWYEIDYENFLRQQQGGTELLPSDITMANVIRYIINYAGRRVVNNKTSITVLDVEPLTQLSSGSEKLTAEMVRSWLPDSVAKDMQIDIVTMSTAEFIGKIEDINEVYDLVYIGASLDNFNRDSSGWPVYNDTNMNGLLYSNIGDTYVSGIRLGGLLDSDYNYWNGNRTWQLSDEPQTYRFSGNDITATKQQELETFAETGFPVVIANELLTDGTQEIQNVQLSVNLSDVSEDNELRLKAEPVWSQDIGSRPVQYTYQWNKDDVPMEGETASTLTVREKGSYTCTVTATIGEATCTAVSGKANVWDDVEYTYTTSGESVTASYYPVEVDGWKSGNKYTFTAMPVGVSGGNVRYQWYRYDGYWKKINGADNNTYTGDKKTWYLCAVTVGGQTYYSQKIRMDGNTPEKDDVADESFDRYDWERHSTSKVTFSAKVEPPIKAANGFTLTGSVDPANLSQVEEIQMYWVDKDGKVISSNPITRGEGTYTFCVKFGNEVAKSLQYTIKKREFSVKIDTAPGTPSTAITLPATNASVNQERVDNSSILYETMINILNNDNVMSDAGTSGNGSWSQAQKSTLLKYLNLSSPSIVFADENGTPQEYTGDYTENLLQDKTLKYTFMIQNPTEATPESTRYTLHLFMDQNADGRHVDTEELGDLVVTDESGARVDYDGLRADVWYTVTRELPENFSGIIPWKLEVVKNETDGGIHASQTGYTYMKPTEMVTLKILQITSGGYALNSDNAYTKLFNALRTAQVYDIDITAVSVDEINNTSKYPDQQSVYTYLNQYNMLILGFDDMYGHTATDKGFTEIVANAVVEYIESGRAVLFTHDTTSFVNLPQSYPLWNSGSIYGDYWGYTFNSIIRSVVGLDRYGVTDAVYGGSAGQLISGSNQPDQLPGRLVASNYDDGTITDEHTEELLEAGYSIAYEPNSNRQKTVEETQGYSLYTLVRYTSGTANQLKPTSTGTYTTGGSNNLTRQVSQVNKGQITTFPYNLNTADFGGTGNTLAIDETHDQYYQLNMNSDDIVVWYCLSGNNFTQHKNDVTNAYYIYNRGNVTYSGAGHSTSSGYQSLESEAQLFVNTMIAAYRAAVVSPTVDFVSEAGDSVESVFLPMEYSVAETTGEDQVYTGTIIADSANPVEICFEIDDPNLDPTKKITVTLYKGDTADEENKVEGVVILNSDGTAADNTAEGTGLRSGTIYTVQLPQSLLTEFGSINEAEQKLTIQVTTTISGVEYTGTDTLSLRKLGLLNLR